MVPFSFIFLLKEIGPVMADIDKVKSDLCIATSK